MTRGLDGTVLFGAGKLRFRSSCLYMLDLAKGLRDAGVDVRIVCSSQGLGAETKRRGIPCAEWTSIRGAWGMFLSGRAVRRFLRAERVRLLHVHGQSLGPFVGLLARRGRLPLVYTPQPFNFEPKEVRRITLTARRVLAMDQDLREDCVNQARAPRDRVVLVRQGVDVDATPLSLPRIGERAAVIGAIGPLLPGKGQDAFLRSARRLLDSGRKAHFVVAGDGPEEGRLRRLWRDLDLTEAVTFATRLTGYLGILESLDIFVRPSRSDGLGYILLRAMALGKAVVGTDVGGVYSFVKDGETGLLVPKDGEEGLTRAMSRLVDEPETAQQIGRRAREFVREEYRLSEAVEGTLAAYEAALREPWSPATG